MNEGVKLWKKNLNKEQINSNNYHIKSYDYLTGIVYNY